MLTFIRIRLPMLTANHPIRHDRKKVLVHSEVTQIAEPAAEKTDEQTVHNPWRGELERLKCGLRSDTDQVRFGVTPSNSSSQAPPAPPPPLPPAIQLRQGTLTDLKIWWGKATLYKAPDPQELAKFAPVPAKKSNRWMQF